MAAWAGVLGWGEHAMHALQALFALAAILAFHHLARRLVPDQALLLTALLALGPGFVVNQNTMVEIPQAAMWIGCYAALIARRRPPTPARYPRAAGPRSAAL